MKKFLTIALMALGAVSCVYPYDPDIEPIDETLPVLDGSIVIGGTSTISISQVYPFSGTGNIGWGGYLSGRAWIEDENGGTYMPSGSPVSNYFSIPTENASPDLKYRLKAEIDGREYSSDWIAALAPPEIESVDFTAEYNDVIVSISMKGGEDGTGYVGLTFEETYEFHSDYPEEYYLDLKSWKVSDILDHEPRYNYWCWKTVSHNSMTLIDFTEMEGGRVEKFPFWSFSRSNERNHRKYSVNVKVHTLPASTYRYLKNLDEISQGGASLFMPNPGEVASNISCESDPSSRVFGYVTVSQVATLRVFLDDRYYKPVKAPTYYLSFPQGENEQEAHYNAYVVESRYPVTEITIEVEEIGEVTGVAWGPISCLDCVTAGGTLVKPEFWK